WTPAPVLPDDLAPAAGEVELVADIWSADARAARQHALLTLAVARLARRRRRERLASPTGRGGPGVDTRATRAPALADVDEAFTAELALIRCCTEGEAGQLAGESVLLCGRLAATWAELYAGRITVAKARALVDLLGAAAADVAGRIERLVLPQAEHRDVAWLRRTVRRHLVRLDSQALEQRREQAKQARDVFRRPTGDGTSELVITQTTGKAAAMAQTLDAYARLLRRDGDPRPIGVLRAEVAFDLITRPWDTSRAPVTAVLTIHAGLDALRPPAPGPDGAPRPQPAGEVDGTPVTAAECRALLAELDLLGIDAAPAGGRVQVAVGDPATGRLHAVATRHELRTAAGRRRTRRRRPAPADPPPGTADTGTGTG
ncbi:13E12 repeat family protein, partial [Geodermatophilus sp. YIM 151500]|uniref:13E12 repeat family protein n=1 Tax=Geodermatophilus sp. YIM 151500 TaxID=2984531 RepID=UPI0021E3C162